MVPALISRSPTRIARREMAVARATKEIPPYPHALASVAAQMRRVCSSRREVSDRNFSRIVASRPIPYAYTLLTKVATLISSQALSLNRGDDVARLRRIKGVVYLGTPAQ